MASVSISCPSCSATDGVVRNGKSTAGHQRYLCSHCRKHGNCSSLTPLLNPVRTRKSLIWP
ncbi:insertion element IS1 protein insA [Shigella dysenteriae 1617]|nr:insertion element IS1 protein insA [Shigella dysenteriae 1617]